MWGACPREVCVHSCEMHALVWGACTRVRHVHSCEMSALMWGVCAWPCASWGADADRMRVRRPWGDVPGEATGTLRLYSCSQTSLATVPRPMGQCPPRGAFSEADSFLADSLVVRTLLPEAAPLGRSASLKGQQGDKAATQGGGCVGSLWVGWGPGSQGTWPFWMPRPRVSFSKCFQSDPLHQARDHLAVRPWGTDRGLGAWQVEDPCGHKPGTLEAPVRSRNPSAAGHSGAQQGGLYEPSSPVVLFAEICNLLFLFSLKIALLRYNSHAIQFAHLKDIVDGSSVP